MSTSGPTNPQYELTAWVVLATDGLVAPARERIKQEIEAHFADAVAKHVASGIPQAAAEAQALDELGDINSAAKGFRKRYLTEKEEKWLREIETQWRLVVSRRRLSVAIGVTALLLGLFVCVAMLFWRHRPNDLDAFELRLVGASVIFGGILVTSLIAVVVRTYRLVMFHPPGIEMRLKLLALGVVQNRLTVLSCCAGPIFFCTQKFFFHPVYASAGAVLIAVLSTAFDRRFHLLRKLRYAQVATDPGVAA